MAQVLINLGISPNEDTDMLGEPQPPSASPSNFLCDLHYMEIPSPDRAEQSKPHFDENGPLDQPE